jgi:hypothetical protein
MLRTVKIAISVPQEASEADFSALLNKLAKSVKLGTSESNYGHENQADSLKVGKVEASWKTVHDPTDGWGL